MPRCANLAPLLPSGPHPPGLQRPNFQRPNLKRPGRARAEAMKAVLVTGGAQRLGAAISLRFAAAGWHVGVHCHTSRSAAQQLVDRIAAGGGSGEMLACDLADRAGLEAMARAFAASQPDWRCLVNSAAVFEPDDAEAIDPAVAGRAFAINALAPMLLAQAFLREARTTSGRRVVQLTDQKLANINPDFFSYTMSKAAVDAAARMLARATRGADRIYRLAPGAILPSHDQTAEEAERSHRLNPLGRRTGAEEIAATALFMAQGPLAGGQQIFVDSGQHLLRQERDVIFLAREEQKSA